MPIQSKGGYQLDFDNLDVMNPFEGSNKMTLSPARPAVEHIPTNQTDSRHTKLENILDEPTKMDSALDETLPYSPSVENSLVDGSTNISSTESSVVTVMRGPAFEEEDSCIATPDEKLCVKMSPNAAQDKASGSFVEDAPLPVKGSYKLNFDNLDAINPFQTGGSMIQNSPVVGKNVSYSNPPVDEVQVKEDKPVDVVASPDVAQELPVQHEVELMTAVDALTNSAKPAAESQPAVTSNKEGPIKLEFNFNDGIEVKNKPPLNKFGKRPPGATSKEKKQMSDNKPPKENPMKPSASDEPLPGPKGSYSFDFDKFDDPYFNPFGTKTSINNSPNISKKSSPVLTEAPLSEQIDKQEEERAASPARYVDVL